MLRTFIDTTDVGDSGWGPLVIDEDWHATCQAIFQGVEGSEWEKHVLQVQGAAPSGQT